MSDLIDAFFENPALASAMNAWQAVVQGSPLTYNEPILPGWTINIDSNNSSSPAMEREILKRASYGKQLGRLSDAVAALIALQPQQEQARFKEFTDLKEVIDDVKRGGLDQRVARVAADLTALRDADSAKFDELSAQLRAAINAPGGSPGSRGNGSPSPAPKRASSGARSPR